jgi:tight adherence protein B
MSSALGVYFAVFAGVFGVVWFVFPALQERMEQWQRGRMNRMTPRLDKMFLDIPIQKLLLLDLGIPLACGAAGFMMTRSLVMSVASAAVGLLIPMIIIKQLEAARRRKFASQLVDGLMILSSSLKAGLSLMQAFESLVEEMSAPISQEFSLVVRQMQMGVSLEEAINNLKKRMKVEELDMVVTAMLVARETGGDLTTTFTRVIYTIQERNKLIGRVNALCIQGKLQGIIMSALPVVFGIFVYKVTPDFFDIFLKDNFGRMLFGYAIISEILGVIFIAKFSKVDV